MCNNEVFVSVETEINQIINKFEQTKIVSKFSHFSKFNKEMTSKFTAVIKIPNLSKYSELPKNIKSDLDIPIPMDVEIRVLKDGDNRDGRISTPELTKSVSKWQGTEIIPFHNMDDMDSITSYSIADGCGSVDSARIEDDGENEWIVTKARITNRNVAYQMYLKELKGEPIEVSAEYKWTMDYDNDGNPLQTNIRPALISLVDKGHITGNQIKIKSQI